MIYEYNGDDKVVYCYKETDDDVETIDVQEVYSKWKEWLASDTNNLKYEMAFKVIGGDQITEDQKIAVYVELVNGWKMQPEDGAYQINILGNLFAENGESPFNHEHEGNITINMNTSSNALVIDIGRGDTTNDELKDQINELRDDLIYRLAKIDTMIELLLDIEQGNWEIRDQQMIFYTREGNELMRFNLFDRNNRRTNLNPFRRERV